MNFNSHTTKKIFPGLGSLLFCMAAMLLMGQTCKRRDPAVITEPLPFEQYTFNSLRIIQEKSDAPFMTVQLVFEGGLRNYTAEEDGIERIAFLWLEQTAPQGKTPGDFRRELKRNGATLTAETHADYSAITLQCLPENFKQSFHLLADLVLHPAWDDSACARIIRSERSRVEKENPGASAISLQKGSSNYLGHTPYSRTPGGNQLSLKSLRPSTVRKYFEDSLRVKNKMWIVVSGFSDQEKLVQEILYTFDPMPAGNAVPATEGFYLSLDSSSLETYPSPSRPTSLRAFLPAPRWTSDEAAAMQVALSVIQNTLQTKLSQQYPYDNPVNISYSRSLAGYAVFSAETEWTSDYARIVMDELIRRSKEGFTDAEVQMQANLMEVDFLLGFQTQTDKCNVLADAAATGNWKAPWQFYSKLRSVNAKEVSETFRAWCNYAGWIVAGEVQNINSKSFLKPVR